MIRQDCLCCKMDLHHCEKCWNKSHHGESHKDFVPPEYYGEPFMDEKITKKFNKEMKEMALKLGKEFKEKERPIKADKNRKYNDGDYNH